jgi:c-di-AMP phosphodiesterase-like protein
MDRRHALFFDAASLDQVEQIRRRVRPINQIVGEVVDKSQSLIVSGKSLPFSIS